MAFRSTIRGALMAVAALTVLSAPAAAEAPAAPYEMLAFADPLALDRGKLLPVAESDIRVAEKDICAFLTNEFGWDRSGCDSIEAIILGYSAEVNTLLVEHPNSEGYVRFEDWVDGGPTEDIDAIWDELVAGAQAQSEVMGATIRMVDWVVYPTLNKEKSYLYYAYEVEWDGAPVINVKASLFDRRGYVTFRIVPEYEDHAEGALARVVESVLDAYSASPDQSYADFADGDEVATVGAVGVLASLAGVKYGKAAAATGFLAVAIAFLKKAWFLIFVPFAFVARLFTRKKG